VIEPLRTEIVVACAAPHAFATWAARFGQWWPRGHSVSGDPVAVVFEPGVGGRIYERTVDGDEIDWGEVVAWAPPRRLAYRWHIRRPAEQATLVEIHFTANGTDSTRVEIVHTGWEVLGAEAESWRDANRGGWHGLLAHFVSACEQRPAAEKERTP